MAKSKHRKKPKKAKVTFRRMEQEAPVRKLLHLHTDDIYWACAYAGTVRSSQRKGTPVSLVLHSNNPAIQYMSRDFPPPPVWDVEETIQIPDEETIAEYDDRATLKRILELQEIHGVLGGADIAKIQLSIQQAAAYDLYERHQIYDAEGEFYYPRAPHGSLYHGVYVEVPYSDSQKICKAFLEGMGISDPKMLNITNLPLVEAVKAMCNPKIEVLVVPPLHEAIVISRAFYKGYEHIKDSFATLLVFPSNYESGDTRRELFWASVILMVGDVEGCEANARDKGSRWQTRCRFQHNLHAYLKSKAKEALSDPEKQTNPKPRLSVPNM